MIPRRMIGFGFALFLILVILSLIYSQYAMRKMDHSVETITKGSKNTTMESAKPLPTTVTADTAADDLIDEAVADRDDLDMEASAEMKAAEEGN